LDVAARRSGFSCGCRVDRRAAAAPLAFERGTAAVALDVHLEGGGVVNEAGRRPLPSLSDRRTRHDTTVLERLPPIVRVIDATHPLYGYQLDVSASRASRRIGWVRVILSDGRHRWIPQKATGLEEAACEVEPNRDLPACRYAPCSPRRNTCGQRFPPQPKGLMEHRALQLFLPFEPELPDPRLILAPRLWPTMTPRARQQLAKRVAHLLRSVLIVADECELMGGPG
jgi:hypothetical protein